jgi:cysteine desulfurase/selenocysteine lyase
VMEYFGVPATARASFSFYNNEQETERLVAALDKARGMFA